MSNETEKKRSFEDRVQDRQDWIEAQFRRISRGSWARIIRMAGANHLHKNSNKPA